MDSTTQINDIGATPLAFNRRASGITDSYGPLETLITGNQWVGDTGFNLMVVPNPTQGFLVMISQLFETHIFTEVPAPVPNRSGQFGTSQIGAVKYSQVVAENVSKNILHEETGMWLNQTVGFPPDHIDNGFGLGPVTGDAIDYVTKFPIMRSGTIPHGNTIHAVGNCTSYPFTSPFSGDTQPYISFKNFQNNGTQLNFLPTFVDGSDPTELQANYYSQIEKSLARIGRSDLQVYDFVNPIGLINQKANNILNIDSLAVTTRNDNGAVINVQFERAFAGPQDFICTFLIETIANTGWSDDVDSAQDEHKTFFQLQYLQSIPLLFPKGYNGKDVLFPHWNFNTLIAI